MKLSASLILFSLVFGVNCAVAVAPGRSVSTHTHPKGSKLHPSSNLDGKASEISTYDSEKQARSFSGAHSREGTTDSVAPRSYSSSWDSYDNLTTSATSHRLQKTPTRKVHRQKRVYSDIEGRRNMKTSASVYMEVRAAAAGGGTSVKSNKAEKKTEKRKRSPSRTQALNTAPTPSPTGSGSSDTTVHINDENDFALLLPKRSGELISDAETDGVSYCTGSGCSNTLPNGFITAAAVTRAPDNSSWIQVTGCIDTSKSSLSPSDDGGQFDVRFPNGAQCLFGGYGASFIEQVEPSANRFCLRCCANANDQENCNSHQDRAGCPIAVPGIYDFPEKGVSCS